jgi:hypothetical protein
MNRWMDGWTDGLLKRGKLYWKDYGVDRARGREMKMNKGDEGDISRFEKWVSKCVALIL